MYKCNVCGTEFEPHVRTFSENLDGERGVEWRREVICPKCSSGRVDDVTSTPNIILRFRDFLAQFSPEEILELDEEIDGISLANYWKNH